MKKVLSILLITVLVLAAFTACGGNGGEQGNAAGDEQQAVTKIVVGASPAPHAEILEAAKPLLAKAGYELEIREFTDYILPNMAVDGGDIDANFFQHQPYMDEFNAQNNTKVVSVAKTHYEPFGIYAGKIDSLDKLEKGSKIAVPSDPTNGARALLLLEQEGIIKLKKDVGLAATVLDVVENPKGVELVELEAALLPRALQDVDVAVINGNYAIEADLAVSDALAVEAADSIAADTFANVLCVKAGNENNEAVQALAKVLQSEEIRKFMEDTYNQAVIPVF